MNHYSITVQNLAYILPSGETLFSDLNISLGNEVTALTGVNGIGKSTLIKIISGVLTQSEGSVIKETPISYLSQNEVQENITIQEYLTWDYTYPSIGEELLGELDREKMCTSLSGGEWMRVRLAKLIKESFLILDEPTNDLDSTSKKILLNYLKKHRSGALIITHDRDCLNTCKVFLEITKHGISKFSGNYQEFKEYRESERERLNETLDKAKKERDALQKKIQKDTERQNKKNQKGSKNALKGGIPKILLGGRRSNAEQTSGKLASSNLKRANESVSEVQEALSKIKTDPVMYADLIGTSLPSQKLIVSAEAFNIKFTDWLYQNDLNFSWAGNIRVLIRGDNGSGKSTLIKAVMGEEFETRGSLKTGEIKKILYLDQKYSTVDLSKTVFDNIQDVLNTSESEIRNGLARFLFKNDDVFKMASDLSGGEKLRLSLAKGFLASNKPELLILDEPTNNLDLVNIDFLEGLIKEYQGALILISHDEEFISNSLITDEFNLSAPP